jgi:hypothetical protein
LQGRRPPPTPGTKSIFWARVFQYLVSENTCFGMWKDGCFGNTWILDGNTWIFHHKHVQIIGCTWYPCRESTTEPRRAYVGLHTIPPRVVPRTSVSTRSHLELWFFLLFIVLAWHSLPSSFAFFLFCCK